MEEKYKNTVIEIHTKEQGKMVKQFWENQGLSTSHFAKLDIGYFYGHNNYDGFDLFRRYDFTRATSHNLKIIRLPDDELEMDRCMISVNSGNLPEFRKKVLVYIPEFYDLFMAERCHIYNDKVSWEVFFGSGKKIVHDKDVSHWTLLPNIFKKKVNKK